jgi:CheY-like chemotaxis protein
VANVLLIEAAPAVAALFAHVIAGLGHAPVHAAEDAGVGGIDAVLLEPADAGALELVRRARTANPSLPLICVSVYPRLRDAAALGPVAYLMKPVSLPELENALTRALR